jgi:hypothetical protein
MDKSWKIWAPWLEQRDPRPWSREGAPREGRRGRCLLLAMDSRENGLLAGGRRRRGRRGEPAGIFWAPWLLVLLPALPWGEQRGRNMMDEEEGRVVARG